MRASPFGRRTLWAAAVVADVLVGGCAVEPVVAAVPPMTSEMEALSRVALADAASRTASGGPGPVLVSAEAVTWGDGSLGCPEPGRVYTMALVPGYRFAIRAGAQLLDYHAGRTGPPTLCPAGRAIAPLPDARR